MSQMEIDRVLAQIRSFSQVPRQGGVGGVGGAGPGAVGGVDNGFAKLLKQGIDSVNSTQSKAADLATKSQQRQANTSAHNESSTACWVRPRSSPLIINA